MLKEVLIGIFILVLAGIMLPLFRDRILFKMGVRNMARRKRYTAIVTFGLMIGTAVITASLAVGDTMEKMIESETLSELYTTDEKIVAESLTDERQFFNMSIFNEVNQQVDRAPIDGLSPSISTYAAVLNLNSNLSETRAQFSGVDFSRTDPFGSFMNQDGEQVKGLEPSEIMVGSDTADDLEAMVGDALIVYANNNLTTFTVTHILRAEERAGSGTGLYVNLTVGQEALGKIGKINEILISNDGGVHEGMEHTEAVKKWFANISISSSLTFSLVDVKQDVVEENREALSTFTDMFYIFGSFSVIAGIILIINIFVMLTEERKSEMGMARAIGMQRVHLKRMYMAEGMLYALGASAVGVVLGISIGYLIMFAMGRIFQAFGAFDILQYFTVTPTSMLIGFVTGFLITIITIFFTVRRVSNLNIVRAIRNISEPAIKRGDRRIMVIGMSMTAIGLLVTLLGIVSRMAAPMFSGVSLIFLGIGTLARRWVGDRIAFSTAAVFIIIWWFLPASWFPDYSSDLEMFIISGLFLVFSSLLLVMFNTKQLTQVITAVMGHSKSMLAVLRTSIAYSLRSRFRTGMTIAIFALIIFSITTMSMIVGILGTNIELQVDKAAGGYDIMAFTLSETPIQDIQAAVDTAGMGDNFTTIASLMSLQANLRLPNQTEDIRYQILGVDESFIAHNTFDFKKLLPEYETSEEAWAAVKNDSSLIIIDSSVLGGQFGPPATFITKVGANLTLRDQNNNTMNKTIIGILDTLIMQGIYSYKDHIRDEFGLTGPTFFLFSAAPEVDSEQAAKELERTFLRYGMQTVVMKTLVRQVIQVLNQFFNLFKSFMGLGLVIGIAGLGIITIRSVHERRQEIGMMRAIGFQRRMVLWSFLIETSFVAVLGIVIGTLLGIFIGYTLWLDEFRPQGLSFMINWQPIVFVGIIALVATLISVIPASRRAANVPPAEALRFHD